MWKETIICAVIIIVIIIGSIVTQNYTEETVRTFSEQLEELKKDLNVAEDNNEEKQKEVKERVKNIEEEWNKRHNKLAYFIEHDELEKIETNITSLTSFIDTREFPEAINELDKTIYVLNHLEEKYKLSLENIF